MMLLDANSCRLFVILFFFFVFGWEDQLDKLQARINNPTLNKIHCIILNLKKCSDVNVIGYFLYDGQCY